MNKKARVSLDPSPSASFVFGEEAKARFKHQCLLQDYQELLKETNAKKERLNKALQRKLMLLAEVKFLNNKYKSLASIPPLNPFRVRKQQPCKQITLSSCSPTETKPPLKERSRKSREVSAQSSTKLADLNQIIERNLKTRGAFVQNTPKLLDLNQVSFPNGEEMEELEVKSEPLDFEKQKLKRSFVQRDLMADDLKVSACRGVGGNLSGWETVRFHGKISSL